MNRRKENEIKGIFGLVVLVFLIFLLIPLVRLFLKSFMGDAGLTLGHYTEVLTGRGFLQAFGNSLLISSVSAVVTTVLAFILAYAVHYCNLPRQYKGFINRAAVAPMLLPTITYGFAIIYSFGKQGLITQMVGTQLFDIYGFNGLLLGYVIYTLPVSFLLLSNTMSYVDKKFSIVSRIMGDSPFATFVGSVPNFSRGACVAMMMLIPSVVTIALLHYLEKYNIRYNKISQIEIRKGVVRDTALGVLSALILMCVLSVFAVIFVVPFVDEWPYRIQFTLEHVISVFSDSSLVTVCRNSLIVAFLTAAAGSLTAYGAALTTARSHLPGKVKQVIENISLITNTIPGMVIGIAYMLVFSGTPLQNTLFIIVICNVIHYFSTPYLMMKSSLAKMNASWETTAMLMGDTWLKTIVRVVTPNAMGTILEVFSYYFVNAMVTVSAVIFIAGARTMVITTKIKELQYYTKFNEVFVLSLLILAVNLAAKGLFHYIATDRQKVKAKKTARRPIVSKTIS